MRKQLKSIFGKAALATAVLAGFFFFAGAPGAEARPVVVRYYSHPIVRYHRPVVVVHPYFRGYHREVFVHGWRDRYGYWHRY